MLAKKNKYLSLQLASPPFMSKATRKERAKESKKNLPRSSHFHNLSSTQPLIIERFILEYRYVVS
jgi:hypothetical protein